jgi:NAD(P)-dependent dehydrogenase (short-subunit alcohol dehydrogenase family)
MNPIYDFKGQVALVTGAAKGMGLATARAFAENGASVVLADLEVPLVKVIEGRSCLHKRPPRVLWRKRVDVPGSRPLAALAE